MRLQADIHVSLHRVATPHDPSARIVAMPKHDIDVLQRVREQDAPIPVEPVPEVVHVKFDLRRWEGLRSFVHDEKARVTGEHRGVVSVSAEVVRCPLDLSRNRALKPFDAVFDDVRVAFDDWIHPRAKHATAVYEVFFVMAALLPVTLQEDLLEPLHETDVFGGAALRLPREPGVDRLQVAALDSVRVAHLLIIHGKVAYGAMTTGPTVPGFGLWLAFRFPVHRFRHGVRPG